MKRSIHTEAVLGVLARMDRMREDAQAFHIPPLMSETLSARDEARKVAQMSPVERKAWIEHVGIHHAVDVAGRIAKSQGGTA